MVCKMCFFNEIALVNPLTFLNMLLFKIKQSNF